MKTSLVESSHPATLLKIEICHILPAILQLLNIVAYTVAYIRPWRGKWPGAEFLLVA